MDKDAHFMHIALQVGRFHESYSHPNPSVGCVLVDEQGMIIAREATAIGGRPHAEYSALKKAGKKASKATLYVTLEPCMHDDTTPSCTKEIVRSGIKKVVIGINDPDPRTKGLGVAYLRNAGISTKVGVLEEETFLFFLGYFSSFYRKRPLVTWKISSSVDGSIATERGESQWITNPNSLRFSHILRAKHDAIVIGSKSCRVDDPLLSCRLRGLEKASPLRVCLDSKLSLSMKSQLVKTAQEIPLHVYCLDCDETQEKKKKLEKQSVKVFFAPLSQKTGKMSLLSILKNMNKNDKIKSLLLEGGAQVVASFIKEDLVDRVFWMHAPLLLGASGKNGIASLGNQDLIDYPQLSLKKQTLIPHKGNTEDRLGIYYTRTMTSFLKTRKHV